MATGLPPPPINDQPGSFTWLEWYRQLRNYISTNGSVPWYVINFAGSNITDIAQRDHGNMQGLQGGTAGEHYHLTAAEYASIGGGGVPDGDKGDIVVSGAGTVWTIDNTVVSLSKMANVGTGTVFYRKTAGTGSPEVQTLATLKTDLGLSGTNSGDNAVNTLYSGLATSKQDVLVSGTNIKTINGTSLLGSGDLVISGSGLSQQQVEGLI